MARKTPSRPKCGVHRCTLRGALEVIQCLPFVPSSLVGRKERGKNGGKYLPTLHFSSTAVGMRTMYEADTNGETTHSNGRPASLEFTRTAFLRPPHSVCLFNVDSGN